MIIQRVSPTEVTLVSHGTTIQLVDAGFVVNKYSITSPGEYDVAGVAFDVGIGYALIHVEQLKVLVIEPSHPQLAAEAVAAIEGVDLVIVPAEADATRRKAVSNLLNDLEPRGIVVLGGADDAKAQAGQAIEPVSKLKLVASDFDGEELRVWAISPALE